MVGARSSLCLTVAGHPESLPRADSVLPGRRVPLSIIAIVHLVLPLHMGRVSGRRPALRRIHLIRGSVGIVDQIISMTHEAL